MLDLRCALVLPEDWLLPAVGCGMGQKPGGLFGLSWVAFALVTSFSKLHSGGLEIPELIFIISSMYLNDLNAFLCVLSTCYKSQSVTMSISDIALKVDFRSMAYRGPFILPN